MQGWETLPADPPLHYFAAPPLYTPKRQQSVIYAFSTKP